MDFLPDPTEMTAEERLLELAAILARGYLRLRKAGFPRVVPQQSADSRLDSEREPTPPLGSGLTPDREIAG